MNWKLRGATPDDAPFLGWACVAAARSQMPRGWFDIIFPDRDEAYLLEYAKYLTLAKAVSWWHWSLFRVAEIDGEIASAMCGFGNERVYYASSAAMDEASKKIGLSEAEHTKLWTRGSFIALTATSERNAWTIENVATDPKYRGSGVSHALVENEIEVARAAGFHRAQVSFFIGNTRAEKLYAKSGFTYAEEKRSREFEAAMGTPGTIRFARNV